MGERATTVALLGAFDLPDLDAQLALRITRQEVQHRRADVEVRLFAPFGGAHRPALAGGEVVERVPEAPGAFAGELDLTILTGDLGALEPSALSARYGETPDAVERAVGALMRGVRGVPLAWHAVRVRPPAQLATQPQLASASVRDHDSLERVTAAGWSSVALAGNPAVLAPRWFAGALLAQRLEVVRALQWWPERGPAVLLERAAAADGAVRAAAAALAGARDAALVTIDIGEPGEPIEGARALPSFASVEDHLAAVAHAEVVVSGDPTLLALAAAFRRPSATPAAELVLADPPAIGDWEARLDADYDGLVALLPAGARTNAAPPSDAGEIVALRAALAAKQEQLVRERAVLADYVRAIRTNTDHQLAVARSETPGPSPEKARKRKRFRRGK